MAELYPLPLRHHLRRIYWELKEHDQVYDLPRKLFWTPDPEADTRVTFHGIPAGTPAGPAAGPQDQLIQNIVLSWLGGSRIVELKTVQIMDELKISRPCIYAGNVGFNVEWSQELRLPASLVEYVAAQMVIDILREEDILEIGSDHPSYATILDLSVGYDLKGISSPQIRWFIEQMQDASQVVDQLRSEIPDEYSKYRDFDFTTDIVKTQTLSTFHGCPKDEIERIVGFLLTEMGVHSIIKLNPTQLGREPLAQLLREKLGYTELNVNPKACDVALSQAEAVAICERLDPVARERGLGLGVKFSNTLEVLNEIGYFPDDVMYMSGPPLHPIAMRLVDQWRQEVGDRWPVTFAAGIDQENFFEAVALGLCPITSCTDLLKTRGYGRQFKYLRKLEKRMKEIGATTVPEFILLHRGQGTADQAGSLEAVRAAALANTRLYAAEVVEDPRYHRANNHTAPKKIGSALYLFDCVACGKCIPVCPNDANFTYNLEPVEVEYRNYKVFGDQVLPHEAHVLRVARQKQWAVYADFCNECGNCDTYCPEDGGPFMEKPKFFGTHETWTRHADRDGFHVARENGTDRVWGRVGGREYHLEVDREADTARFTDHVIELELDRSKPQKPKKIELVGGGADGHVLDMKTYFWLDLCREGVLNHDRLNYVNVATYPGS